MTYIGLIADTHNFLDEQVFTYFDGCDEIWHVGDFGTLEVANRLSKIAPIIGVYGNVDGDDVRRIYPLHQRFSREGVDVWMTHIGGTPGRYALPIRKEMDTNPPDLFICGHSHILKIVRDPHNSEMIFMNPGAAGKQGFHVYRTIVRFYLDGGKIRNCEVINLSKQQ